MIFYGAGDMGVKAQDAGQGLGATMVASSAGFMVFIEGHPVLMSAIGMLLGLTIQGISVFCSVSSKRAALRAKLKEEIRREIEEELAAEAIEKTDLVPPEEGSETN